MFNKDIGIDLGTANTLVYVRGKGIVMNEPSVVAVDSITREVLAVGSEAKAMLGRTPGNITAIKPMKSGVIADFDVTEAMLKYFISSAYPKSMFGPKPRVVISVPVGVTEVEKRAVIEAAVAAGAKDKQVLVTDEPMAAAIGADLNIAEATGSMIVDIGGGTSEVAVISLGGIVASKSVRVAGDDFDENIINFVRKEYNIAIGERTAERIKIKLSCAYIDATTQLKEMKVKGRDLSTGLPKQLTINTHQVKAAMAESIETIVDAIKEGRRVYDNIKKTIKFLLPTSIAEGLIVLISIILNNPLPLEPVQLLWINMVSAITISFAFVFEPAENDIMNKNPRKKSDSIIKSQDTIRILYVATMIAGLGLIISQHLTSLGISQNIVSTVTLNIVVFCKIFYLFNIRTDHSAISKNLFTNKVAFLVVGILISLQMAITYMPQMHIIFRTASLQIIDWLYPFYCGLILFSIVEIEKFLSNTLKKVR